jgi:serine/threonine protein kinase/Tfp pilus assembly protein PilF
MPGESAQVEEIFSEAIKRGTGAERSAYLEAACAKNPPLLRRVQELLAAHNQAETFLSQPPSAVQNGLETALPPAQSPVPEGPGARIGRYKLLQQIGEGGFGVVFMAEQEEPVRRMVALKVIKLGMDTRQVVARFEAERQALAMMDHPNVARVLDGGATETGRPYFVMELVKGIPITDYCDKNNLQIRARLELFNQVCQAVQHAHQKGLIHRDIKPSNILVSTQDGRPVAKVIDFGIAKATQARLTEKTLFTEFRQLVGTPQYMSPEQAEGSLDVDTRSDIYSLGVLLYELLTGTTPFEPKELLSKAYAEIQRIIREVDPPKPSTRISTMQDTLPTVAAHRGIEPKRLGALVRGELDWVVMKAMDKDRTRRYETANGLAMDVQRFLADEQVSAAPPSTAYQLRKFVRRNRGPVVAGTLVLLTLIAGVIGTSIGLVGQARQRRIAEQQRAEAERQEAEAKKQAAIAQAIQQFQSDMLASADPDKMLGDKVTVLQAATAAIKELDAGKLKDQPLVEIGVRDTISNTLNGLGRYTDAEAQQRRALQIRRSALAPDDHEIAVGLNNLGEELREQGNYAQAEGLYREALEIDRKAGRTETFERAKMLNNLAMVVQAQAKYPEAEGIYREAVDLVRRTHEASDSEVATFLSNLAWVLHDQGKLAEAEPLCREALTLRRNALPPGHPMIAQAASNLGALLQAQGRLAESESLLSESLEAARKALPEGHPDIATSLNNLAGVLMHEGKYAAAESSFREALKIQRNALRPGHPKIALQLNNLGLTLYYEGKYEEAEPLYREALEIRRGAYPADHPEVAQTINNLALLYQQKGNFAAAAPLYREALEMYRKTLPADHPEIAQCLNNLAASLQDSGDPAGAEALLRQAVEINRTSLPARHPELARSLTNLAQLLWINHKYAEAEGFAREAVEIDRTSLPSDHPDAAAAMNNLGLVLQEQGKLTEAKALFRGSLEIRRKTLPPGSIELAVSVMNLGRVLWAEGRFAEAEPLCREALGVLDKAGGRANWVGGNVMQWLGRVLTGLKRWQDAETTLLESDRLLAEAPKAERWRHEGTVRALIALYTAWDQAEPGKGYDAKAHQWQSHLPATQPSTTTATTNGS